MRAIDRKQYHATTLEHLNRLQLADPMRSGYYIDLANKWSTEDVLESWIALGGSFNQTVDLSQLNLVTLYYEQYLCIANRVDLRNCPLRATANAMKLAALRSCCVNVIDE